MKEQRMAELEALVAAPAAWFTTPEADEPTPFTVTKEGRVYGHLAAWGTCHTGYTGQCIQPPRSASGYAYFNAGEIETDEGERFGVGQVTLDTGHAALSLDARSAAAHYDDTGVAVCDVHAVDGAHGIWLAGALRDNLPPGRIRELMAAKLSGDWRTVKGRLELLAALAVNVPGFPIPRAQARLTAAALTAAGVGQPLTLIASGIVTHDTPVSHAEYERRTRILAARAEGGIEALAALAEGGQV